MWKQVLLKEVKAEMDSLLRWYSTLGDTTELKKKLDLLYKEYEERIKDDPQV
jgi:hypothetical protein